MLKQQNMHTTRNRFSTDFFSITLIYNLMVKGENQCVRQQKLIRILH